LSFKTLEDQATIFLSLQRSFYIPSSVKNEYQSSKKIGGERLLNIKIEEQRLEAVL
jgi:retron-type reverse transcriptase